MNGISKELVTKVRSGVHKPTRLHKNKKAYNRKKSKKNWKRLID